MLLTGWLPLGAVVIPALAIPTVYFIHGKSIELVCVLIATVIMLIRHRKGIYRIIPVSYTHLDVYKRQDAGI